MLTHIHNETEISFIWMAFSTTKLVPNFVAIRLLFDFVSMAMVVIIIVVSYLTQVFSECPNENGVIGAAVMRL